MSVIRKASSNKKIITKKKDLPKVRSTRQPSTIREMGDVDFYPLNNSKDGYSVMYDSQTNRFMLMSADDVLVTSTETPVPDVFITQLEQQINLGDVIDSIDGGVF